MLTKNENVGYVINGNNRFNDLALLYYPKVSTTSAASRKLKKEMLKHPKLLERLSELDFSWKNEYLTPYQQECIIECFGPPVIEIKNKF